MSESYWNKMLSAYLDGELSPAEQVELERALTTDPTLAQRVAELGQLTSLLQTLPQLSAPAQAVRKVLRRLIRSDRSLLDAYVDGELHGMERKVIEKYLLRKDPTGKARQEVELSRQWLGLLPHAQLPADFSRQLLIRLAKERISPPALSDENEIMGDRQEASEQSDAHPVTPKRPYHELLTAYLDGELSPRLTRVIEKKLRESANARRVLGELHSLRNGMQSLSRERAPLDTSLRLIQNLQTEFRRRELPTAASVEELAVENASVVTATESGRWVATEPESIPSRAGAARVPKESGEKNVRRLVAWGVAAALLLAIGITVPLVRNTETKVAQRAAQNQPEVIVATEETDPRPEPRSVPAVAHIPATVPEVVPSVARANPLDSDVPIDGLAGLSMTELAKLDGGIVRLWCSDTKPAMDRLWIVLNDNEASIRSGNAKEVAETPNDDSIEVTVSMPQLAEILRDLVYAEQNRQLFARVDVEDDLPHDTGDVPSPRRHQLVARIDTANPIGMPLLRPATLRPGETVPNIPVVPVPPAPTTPVTNSEQMKSVEAPLPSRLTLRFVLEKGN